MTCHNMSKRDKKKQTNQNIQKNKKIQTNQNRKKTNSKGESKSEEKWYYFQNKSKKNNR